MTVLNSNLKVWFGDDGQPLKNGYIYVGQPNQDPINFEKTVTFRDSQGNETTADQPLRTNSDGRIQFNGRAIIAHVSGDCSLLIQNSNQVQIKDGYIPFVEDETQSSGSATDLSAYRYYGLTLAEIKTIDVSVGETIGNMGKLTAEDEEGAEWLVISATGSPGDDIDLIDFDNGLQGRRNKNFINYARSAQDRQDIRDNIDVYSKSEAIEDAAGTVATSNYADGSITNVKVGNSELGAEKFQTGTTERDWVLARTAAASSGVVGSYAFARNNDTGTAKNFGDTLAGSNLQPCDADGTVTGSSSLSGTWRCMGRASTAAGGLATAQERSSLWLRIS